MVTNKRIVAYSSESFTSLKNLELMIEGDEAAFTAKITKLQLAENSGTEMTAITYEKIDRLKTRIALGHLELVEYTNEVDEITKTAIQTAQDNQFILKGDAYVNNQIVKVLAFREHS